MLTPRYTTAFKKDYKRLQKRGYDMGKLCHVVDLLLNEKPLPETYNTIHCAALIAARAIVILNLIGY